MVPAKKGTHNYWNQSNILLERFVNIKFILQNCSDRMGGKNDKEITKFM
jgi:hypothetical protein